MSSQRLENIEEKRKKAKSVQQFAKTNKKATKGGFFIY